MRKRILAFTLTVFLAFAQMMTLTVHAETGTSEQTVSTDEVLVSVEPSGTNAGAGRNDTEADGKEVGGTGEIPEGKTSDPAKDGTVETQGETAADPTKETTAEPQETAADPTKETTAEPQETAADPTKETTAEPQETATADPAKETTAEPQETVTTDSAEGVTDETEEVTETETESPDEVQKPAANGKRLARGRILQARRDVTDLQLLSMRDGTEDFDADNEPGHDENDHNGILRTFDTLTYDLRMAVQVPPDPEYQEPQPLKVYVRVLIPGLKTGDVVFLTDTMSWLEEVQQQETEEGLELTGSTTLTGDDNAAWWADFPISMKAYKMKQGDTFAPQFYTWTEGQETPASVTDGTQVTVSAKTTLNTTLYLSPTSKDSTYDVGEESVYGRMAGVEILLSMVSEHDGYKGMELPEGEITFDLQLKMEKINSDETTVDVTETYQPILWDYHQGKSDQGKTGYNGRAMIEEVVPDAYLPYGEYTDQYPERCVYDSGDLTITQEGSVLHVTISGYRFADQLLFPQYGRDQYIAMFPNYAVFSCAFLQILLPCDLRAANVAAQQYTGTVSAENLCLGGEKTAQANESDDAVSSSITAENGGFHQGILFFHEGDYSLNETEFRYPSTVWRTAAWNSVESVFTAYAGEEMYLCADGYYELPAVSKGTYGKISGIDYLVKIPDCIELTEEKEKIQIVWGSLDSYVADGSWRQTRKEDNFIWDIFYAVKPDGTGWTDEQEMDEMREEGLKYYPTREEAASHGEIVGIYFEGRGGTNTQDAMTSRIYFIVPVQVKEGTAAGNVFQCNQEVVVYYYPTGIAQGQGIRAWLDKTDSSNISSISYTLYKTGILDYFGENAGFNSRHAVSKNYEYKFTLLFGNCSYQKAVYNEDGTITKPYTKAYNKAGTSYRTDLGQFGGASLLIVGAEACIRKEIEQLDSDGNARSVYDLSQGQNRADFRLDPIYQLLGNSGLSGKTDTLTITDTLDEGLTYVKGSAVQGGVYDTESEKVVGGTPFEPVVTKDETTGIETLTWVLPDVEVGTLLESIHYSCSIDPDMPNNSMLSNTVTIVAANGTQDVSAANGNLSTVSLRVRRSSSIELYKTVDKAIEELNGEICYTVTMSNHSSGAYNNLLLRDILPYNQDAMGTDLKGGGYTVTEIECEGGTDTKLYYTADPDARRQELADLDPESWNILHPDEQGIYQVGKENEEIAALAWTTSLPADESITLRIHLKLDGTEGGALLCNRVQAYTENHQQLTTAKVETVLVERKISGVAWLDSDRDGVRSEGEPLLKAVTVRLLDENGNPAVDIDGKEVEACQTEADGSYCFGRLAPGNYQVIFTDGNGAFEGYDVTVWKAENATEESNSDAVGIYEEGVLISAVITQITLPGLEQLEEEGAKLAEIICQDVGFVSNVKQDGIPKDEIPGDEGNASSEPKDAVSSGTSLDAAALSGSEITAAEEGTGQVSAALTPNTSDAAPISSALGAIAASFLVISGVLYFRKKRIDK